MDPPVRLTRHLLLHHGERPPRTHTYKRAHTSQGQGEGPVKLRNARHRLLCAAPTCAACTMRRTAPFHRPLCANFETEKRVVFVRGAPTSEPHIRFCPRCAQTSLRAAFGLDHIATELRRQFSRHLLRRSLRLLLRRHDPRLQLLRPLLRLNLRCLQIGLCRGLRTGLGIGMRL